MALKIDLGIAPERLRPAAERLFEVSAQKIIALEKRWDPAKGTPVFTAKGKYTSRGWTEWTQGFQFGSALLQFDATGERQFLNIGRSKTVALMATHVSHMGVHDHGFNNVSTYGNLWRLMREGRIPFDSNEKNFYELALKVSGAVQGARWTQLDAGTGFIYSFNGPHSLFVDTLRSLRSLALAYRLGHVLMSEHDERISLLGRLVAHAQCTARYNIFYGIGRDAFDVRGRTVHESIFNLNDGHYRCPSSQQGYSPFSTWTRGLAWAILGFSEQLEFLASMTPSEMRRAGEELEPGKRSRSWRDREIVEAVLLEAALVTADFYLDQACADGIPVWDTGAPNLHRLGNYGKVSANPFNSWEPIDSSAAAIAAQGLLRLGRYLSKQGNKREGNRYFKAGLTTARTLFHEPYLSTSSPHEGLLLHSVYHRPKGWDYVHPGQKVPNGESSMWGDYHARELALLILRMARGEPYLTFFGPSP